MYRHHLLIVGRRSKHIIPVQHYRENCNVFIRFISNIFQDRNKQITILLFIDFSPLYISDNSILYGSVRKS